MADRSTLVITDQDAVTMTATTTGTARSVGRYTEALVFVDVTAATGTLDITVQVSPTASDGPWVTHSTFTQITGTGTALKTLTNIGPYLRIKYTCASSPSFTLSSYIALKN